MAVHVVHDGTKPGEVQERCCLCRTKTRYWYTPKDVALCQQCAQTATAKEIPTKREWIAKESTLMPKPYSYQPR